MKFILSRSFAVLFVVLLTFSSLAIFNVKARTYPPPTLKIQLISPSNTTYNQHSILINLSCQKEPDDWNQYNIDYTIEGEKANYSGIFLYMQQPTSNQLNFSKKITGIPDSTYLLTISAKYLAVLYWDYADKQTVTFTIDTETPTPQYIEEYRGFNIVKLEDKYGVTETGRSSIISPLFSSIEEAKEWIDAGPTTTPNPPKVPTTIVIASVIIVSIVAIGILAYFKKYKK
jgi:hypothetical protein